MNLCDANINATPVFLYIPFVQSELQFLTLSLIHKLAYFHCLSAANLPDAICPPSFSFHPMTQTSFLQYAPAKFLLQTFIGWAKESES